MARRKDRRGPAPIPPANDTHIGPHRTLTSTPKKPTAGTGFHEQDEKRRLGDFTGAGEHSIQQPGGRQAANRE